MGFTLSPMGTKLMVAYDEKESIMSTGRVNCHRIREVW
jgi:hypothetical protein